MQTLTLHFDFTDHPPPNDPDLFFFRRELSHKLEKILRASASGRWRGGRYARGVVTLYIEVANPQTVLPHVHTLLATRGLKRVRFSVGDTGPALRSDAASDTSLDERKALSTKFTDNGAIPK